MVEIAFLDLKTQYLFQELGMRDNQNGDPTKLKLAVAGLLSDKQFLFYDESQAQELFMKLNQVDLIVGRNLIGFDYLVLQPYIKQNVIQALQDKTFDIMLELEKSTRCWTSLDNLYKRNLGMTKTIETLIVPKMWREGKQREVKEYLLNDLKMTAKFFLCMIKILENLNLNTKIMVKAWLTEKSVVNNEINTFVADKFHDLDNSNYLNQC
ncbi:MAG TPA: hypothetical protein VN368_02320 [Candidatus Methylomirabilis sp.]|nr:hypothetical protein [Candidatus Methylomirabilis sp.]